MIPSAHRKPSLSKSLDNKFSLFVSVVQFLKFSNQFSCIFLGFDYKDVQIDGYCQRKPKFKAETDEFHCFLTIILLFSGFLDIEIFGNYKFYVKKRNVIIRTKGVKVGDKEILLFVRRI